MYEIKILDSKLLKKYEDKLREFHHEGYKLYFPNVQVSSNYLMEKFASMLSDRGESLRRLCPFCGWERHPLGGPGDFEYFPQHAQRSVADVVKAASLNQSH